MGVPLATVQPMAMQLNCKHGLISATNRLQRPIFCASHTSDDILFGVVLPLKTGLGLPAISTKCLKGASERGPTEATMPFLTKMITTPACNSDPIRPHRADQVPFLCIAALGGLILLCWQPSEAQGYSGNIGGEDQGCIRTAVHRRWRGGYPPSGPPSSPSNV